MSNTVVRALWSEMMAVITLNDDKLLQLSAHSSSSLDVNT